MPKITNPDEYFGRFVLNFALAFSACLVAVAITWLLGRFDMVMAAIWSTGFSALFGLIRAGITKPGESFWAAPFRS